MLKRLPTLLAPALIALTLLLGTACIELQQEISINDDNTGDFKIYFTVPNKAMDILGPYKDDLHFLRFLDPAQGAAYFSEVPEIGITKYRVFEHEGRKYVTIVGKMKDVKKVLASGKLGKFEFSKTKEKSTRLEMKLELPEGFKEDPAAAKALAGLKIDLKLDVPEKITKAGTQTIAEKSAIWNFHVDKDPSFLKTPPSIFVEYK